MIKATNGGKTGEYGKDFMKIKFISDHDSPLKKQLNFHAMTIIIRSFFEENGKYYPQIFLDECFIWVIKMLKELIFQRELILIEQVHQNIVCFVIIGISKHIDYKFESNVCKRWHNVLMTAYKLKNIAILNVNGVDYRCIIWSIS